MSRRTAFLLVPLLGLLGACGSSKPGSASVTSASTMRSVSASVNRAPRVASPSTHGAPATASRGAANARVPAMFVIRAGGRLSPPSVSSPAFLAVQLTVVSADDRLHRLLLRTPRVYSLPVAPGGRTAILVRGLRAGRYRLEIDGARRGTLIIGVAPRP